MKKFLQAEEVPELVRAQPCLLAAHLLREGSLPGTKKSRGTTIHHPHFIIHFFQYNFGMLPYRKPITVVVGKPIPVEKVEDPTSEQILAMHAKYISALVRGKIEQ